MKQEDGYLRRTTTPRRHRVRRSPSFPRIGLVALVVGLSFFAVSRFLGGGETPLSAIVECEGADCATPELQLAASQNSAPQSPPCPYCNQDADRWRSMTQTPPPEIGGGAAVVVEGSCGEMVFGLNANTRLPPASLTKMATALVVIERGRLQDTVDIKINGWDLAADDGSSIMGLEVGMRLTVEELLYGLLLASGNDAALALADYLGGSDRMVSLMNARVRGLGLQDTNLTNPDGRHQPNQLSTPLDMALLGREFLANPKLKEIANTLSFVPRWSGGTVWNTNALLTIYPGAEGVKTGFTEEADYTIVAAARRDGRLLIVSVFGSWNLYTDAIRLLDWAFANTRSSCVGRS
jgi:serine-type D-Ala-D-Ala carboxypeptidase (penicillin-binding protein 5/6)